jgi:hypothetical protein
MNLWTICLFPVGCGLFEGIWNPPFYGRELYSHPLWTGTPAQKALCLKLGFSGVSRRTVRVFEKNLLDPAPEETRNPERQRQAGIELACFNCIDTR